MDGELIRSKTKDVMEIIYLAREKCIEGLLKAGCKLGDIYHCKNDHTELYQDAVSGLSYWIEIKFTKDGVEVNWTQKQGLEIPVSTKATKTAKVKQKAKKGRERGGKRGKGGK